MAVVVAVELEEELVKACEEGDVEGCGASVAALQSRYGVTAEAVQELLGYAFSCAAAHNQIAVMELLLGRNDNGAVSKDVHEVLLYGMCRRETFFPRRPRFRCCYALRYLAYAAVACVEHNALQALEFLVRQQTPPTAPLLVDTDVVRCFRYALELGSDFHAPAPEAYRPMLMLLLLRFPMLLLPHVDGKQLDVDVSVDDATKKHVQALRSSLLYEYVTNPQMQTQMN
ncbi:hypothetical protein PHYPSEUDO_004816 [Phytophthora pseudosyringae]|uniref:Uncharacterized protein n=1 Tax=Phytophthora pseudosyringae TaxID=221518 RepID=A0A8T1VMV6_9STRA|nr:hypothetical protein PHYPSEUDO_004816 [Phytophthora pseudosyringae]